MSLVLAIILNPKAHFGCDDCRQSFSSLVELSLHCREKHSEVGNYMLSLNPSKLDKWNLWALNECLGVFRLRVPVDCNTSCCLPCLIREKEGSNAKGVLND